MVTSIVDGATMGVPMGWYARPGALRNGVVAIVGGDDSGVGGAACGCRAQRVGLDSALEAAAARICGGGGGGGDAAASDGHAAGTGAPSLSYMARAGARHI